jgi:3-hydroxypropanoate dehydrogenase
MHHSLSDEALDQIFRQARTHTAWLDKPVSDDTLRQVHDLMKLVPTSANTNPAHFLLKPACFCSARGEAISQGESYES